MTAGSVTYQDAIRELPDHPLERGLTLVGFMGIGKTTVGAELARRLGWPLVDTDALVEEGSQKTIREIFDWFGEPYFRDLERAVIAAEAGAGRQILSVGGGAFMEPTTQQLLLDRYTVIYLAAPWSYMSGAIGRLKHSRPLLRNRSLREIEELFNSRHASYDRAHLRVSVPGRTPAQVATKILQMLGWNNADFAPGKPQAM